MQAPTKTTKLSLLGNVISRKGFQGLIIIVKKLWATPPAPDSLLCWGHRDFLLNSATPPHLLPLGYLLESASALTARGEVVAKAPKWKIKEHFLSLFPPLFPCFFFPPSFFPSFLLILISAPWLRWNEKEQQWKDSWGEKAGGSRASTWGKQDWLLMNPHTQPRVYCSHTENWIQWERCVVWVFPSYQTSELNVPAAWLLFLLWSKHFFCMIHRAQTTLGPMREKAVFSSHLGNSG